MLSTETPSSSPSPEVRESELHTAHPSVAQGRLWGARTSPFASAARRPEHVTQMKPTFQHRQCLSVPLPGDKVLHLVVTSLEAPLICSVPLSFPHHRCLSGVQDGSCAEGPHAGGRGLLTSRSGLCMSGRGIGSETDLLARPHGDSLCSPPAGTADTSLGPLTGAPRGAVAPW